MGIITGGITGNVSGQVAGVVFSEARGRTGKLNTVRQKVIPSNPKSPDQVTQRTKFSDAIAIVRALGPRAYQKDWDRAIGQLPGFQSWTSVLLNNMDSDRLLTAPPSIPLGTLPEFSGLEIEASTTSGEIDFSWTTTTLPPGTALDELNAAAIPAASSNREQTPANYFQSFAVRSAAEGTITGLTGGVSYIVIAWAQDPDATMFTPTFAATITVASVKGARKAA